ncbi:MAG: hypothetical protein AAB845_00635 [Patescibacteria group bacterium]
MKSISPARSRGARRIGPDTNLGLLQDFPDVHYLKPRGIRSIEDLEAKTEKALREMGVRVEPIKRYMHNSFGYELKFASK